MKPSVAIRQQLIKWIAKLVKNNSFLYNFTALLTGNALRKTTQTLLSHYWANAHLGVLQFGEASLARCYIPWWGTSWATRASSVTVPRVPTSPTIERGRGLSSWPPSLMFEFVTPLFSFCDDVDVSLGELIDGGVDTPFLGRVHQAL